MSRPLIWYLRRHPLLYKIRYRLLSKTASLDEINSFSYNDINSKSKIPNLFFEVNSSIFRTIDKQLNDFEKAQVIAVWLKRNIKGGPGLGKSSGLALRKMLDGDGGVCSDFSQIFSNFCVINDLNVREWGIKNLSDNPNFSGGHSYNEVYCSELKKWVLIDVAKSILLYEKNTKLPLSSLEYIELKKKGEEIIISTIVAREEVDIENIRNIFLLSESLAFLITNYDNKSIDSLLDRLSFFPESIIHAIILMLGKGYHYKFPESN